MRTIDTIRRSAVAVAPGRGIAEVAALMDSAGVGLVAVLEGETVVGVVTDRDLVRRSLARRQAPDARVDGVMSSPVVTIDADADLHDAFAVLRTHPVRRLVVLDQGRFAGVISVDDLLIDLAADLQDLARPVTAEVVFGHHDSALPA